VRARDQGGDGKGMENPMSLSLSLVPYSPISVHHTNIKTARLD
jgi:hypothetical protein